MPAPESRRPRTIAHGGGHALPTLAEGNSRALKISGALTGVYFAVELGIGLCRGLAAAHRHGVLHRDIKLANAILSETPAAFALSRARVMEGS